MNETAELAEFDRLVAAGAIRYLPRRPLAMRPRGWVDGAEPGDPVVKDILATQSMEAQVPGD